MYGIFDMKKHKLFIQNKEYSYYENNEYVVAFDGLLVVQIELFLEEVNSESDWMKAFAGPFMLVMFQKKSGKILITQHLFGNGKNLYLWRTDDIVFFASSLREIKEVTKIQYKLNVPMLPYYFYNGFLPGFHTLIAGVQKLEAGTCIMIDHTGIYKKKLKLVEEPEKTDLKSLAEEYQNVLTSSIHDVTKDIQGDISLALSGGYDSNCILYSVRKERPSVKINAFSVGGVNGADETKIAASITKLYKDIVFKFSYVSPNTLEYLDDIVRILEGAVYERGIFLQYELAKLLKSNRIHHLVCGECADQVFNRNTYVPIPNDTFLYGYQDTPYQMAVNIVLRKSRMMMGAFGIDARYPFLTTQMLSMGYTTRKKNGVTKEFHKAQCRKMFSKRLMELIETQGGSTDLQALFFEDFDCSQKLEQCKYYSSNFKLTKKYGHEEAVKDYYLSLLYLESFEKQFCD